MRNQRGFTMIELIVVIVILGILSATALPRFINVQSEARVASVNGMVGGLRSAASLARAAWLVAGSSAATTVTMDGQTVVVTANGYPARSAAGIGAAMQSIDGYTADYTATPATFTPTGGTTATCQANYANVGTVGTAAVVGSIVGTC